MKLKMILASAAIAAISSTAFAQTGSMGESGAAADATAGGAANTAMTFTSPEEETMWTSNMEYMGGFFTDDTMAELRSEEEISTAYGGLTADQQAKLKADCSSAEQNRGSFGEVSLTLCSQLNAL